MKWICPGNRAWQVSQLPRGILLFANAEKLWVVFCCFYKIRSQKGRRAWWRPKFGDPNISKCLPRIFFGKCPPLPSSRSRPKKINRLLLVHMIQRGRVALALSCRRICISIFREFGKIEGSGANQQSKLLFFSDYFAVTVFKSFQK